MRTSLRLQLSTILCTVPLLPIAARLVYLQVVRHKSLAERVENRTIQNDLEILPRGRILDRNGRVLAQSVPVKSAFLDREAFRRSSEPAEKRLQEIAAALGLDPGRLRADLPLHAPRAGAKRARNFWLKRDLSEAELEALEGLAFPSIGISSDQRRFYPNGSLARPILGAVNHEGRGSGGIEVTFDKALSAKSVAVVRTRDGSRSVVQETRGEAEPPPDLELTIDASIQFFAETELDKAVAKHKAEGGTVLIQDPRTGEILAMATQPRSPFRNRAVMNLFEPGSTFKIVMAAAALEKGLLAPGETIHCEDGRWPIVPTVTIKDHEKHGRLTLAEIVRYSSNIGSAKVGLRLGASEIVRFCKTFGFGYKTGIALPGETFWKPERAKNMRDVRLANIAFGQGIAVTPLQIVNAFSAIANGGLLMEPRIAGKLGGETWRGPVRIRRVASPGTIAKLAAMLESVVEEGTGRSARIPGYRVAGKTGTAQKKDDRTGTYSATDYMSSFAGYFPAEDPSFTILVVIDSPQDGHYGSEVAAPTFAALAKRLLSIRGIVPSRPLPLRWSPSPVPRLPAKPALPGPRPLPRPSILNGRAAPPPEREA